MPKPSIQESYFMREHLATWLALGEWVVGLEGVGSVFAHKQLADSPTVDAKNESFKCIATGNLRL